MSDQPVQAPAPSKADKVAGVVGIMVGKITGNETKVQLGKDKLGQETKASDGDTTHSDHPGISYTKRGAMKQINIRPPPSSSNSDPEPEEEIITHNEPSIDPNHPGIGKTRNGAMRQPNIRPPSDTPNNPSSPDPKWTENTTGTYNFGTNLDTHPHVDYAGPDLTRVIHSSGDDDDLAIVQEKQDQEERYDNDFLHGGFPTGAPSPGLRARGAEVVDKFDR